MNVFIIIVLCIQTYIKQYRLNQIRLLSSHMIDKFVKLQHEIHNMTTNPPKNWKLVDPSFKQMKVQIYADITAPYYGEVMTLIITIPQNYPASRPIFKIKEFQKVFHPNISKFGSICHQTVNSLQPAVTIRVRVDAFVSLLSNPNAQNTNNLEAASLYKNSQIDYYRKALTIFRGIQKMKISEQDKLKQKQIQQVQRQLQNKK